MAGMGTTVPVTVVKALKMIPVVVGTVDSALVFVNLVGRIKGAVQGSTVSIQKLFMHTLKQILHIVFGGKLKAPQVPDAGIFMSCINLEYSQDNMDCMETRPL